MKPSSCSTIHLGTARRPRLGEEICKNTDIVWDWKIRERLEDMFILSKPIVCKGMCLYVYMCKFAHKTDCFLSTPLFLLFQSIPCTYPWCYRCFKAYIYDLKRKECLSTLIHFCLYNWIWTLLYLTDSLFI